MPVQPNPSQYVCQSLTPKKAKAIQPQIYAMAKTEKNALLTGERAFMLGAV